MNGFDEDELDGAWLDDSVAINAPWTSDADDDASARAQNHRSQLRRRAVAILLVALLVLPILIGFIFRVT